MLKALSFPLIFLINVVKEKNMKIKSALLLVIMLCLSLSYSANATIPNVTDQGKPFPSLAPMLKKINSAVVNISTYSTQQALVNPLLNDPFFKHFFELPEQDNLQQQAPQKRQQSAGSGVIINAQKGIIMTNFHVIKNADEVQVSLIDGRSYKATVIGSDPELDIAILAIKAQKLTQIAISESILLEVGDFVVAIGNPFGLGQTVTTGIVSALGRSGLGIEGYENFIQTDASINPGNSGGALVNLNGELVGINTAIIAPAGGNIGIGFAIPINMAKASMEQIIKYGEVKRGQIGVAIQDITRDLSEALGLKNGQLGVLVAGVTKDSPAEKSG
ncbi:MAG: S1-C subfamily serine protease, partial [Sphingobacteriales bacterium]